LELFENVIGVRFFLRHSVVWAIAVNLIFIVYAFFDYHLYPYPSLFTYCTGYDVYNSVITS